jgi:hypothetical protein
MSRVSEGPVLPNLKRRARVAEGLMPKKTIWPCCGDRVVIR